MAFRYFWPQICLFLSALKLKTLFYTKNVRWRVQISLTDILRYSPTDGAPALATVTAHNETDKCFLSVFGGDPTYPS